MDKFSSSGRCAYLSILILNGQLCFKWCVVGVELRSDTSKHGLKRGWTTYLLNFVKHYRHNSPHDWET